jgi:hypothetical protein
MGLLKNSLSGHKRMKMYSNGLFNHRAMVGREEGSKE